MPTPGAIVVALQLQGGAAPSPEAAADITKLILEASPVVQGVVALLLLSSVLSWAIVFYKAAVFRRLRLTLFHAGRLDSATHPPARPPVSVTGWTAAAPAIAQAAQRYVAQVTLSLRPATVKHIEHDLREFAT